MHEATFTAPFDPREATSSLTGFSVLTLAGQRFGFPQGNNFGAILMSAGTKVSWQKNADPKIQCWFPVNRFFENEQGVVKFRSEVNGFPHGLYGNEKKNKFTGENPNLLTAYVVTLHDLFGKADFGYDPPHCEQGERAIAAMLVPVIAGMPDDAAHAMKCNLMQARDWFFWPYGQSDAHLFSQAEITSGNPDGSKDLWLPYYKGSPLRYLELKYSDEYAGKRREAKAKALGVAREFLEKAHEIYARYVPKALENRYGETRWQLPQLAQARAA